MFFEKRLKSAQRRQNTLRSSVVIENALAIVMVFFEWNSKRIVLSNRNLARATLRSQVASDCDRLVHSVSWFVSPKQINQIHGASCVTMASVLLEMHEVHLSFGRNTLW